MKYMLICQHCGHKHFTDGSDTTDLIEVPTASPPKHANGTSKDICDLPKKFKCYKCGYVFKIVKLNQEMPKPTQKEKNLESIEEDYFNKWNNEVLNSHRKKTLPPQDIP